MFTVGFLDALVRIGVTLTAISAAALLVLGLLDLKGKQLW